MSAPPNEKPAEHVDYTVSKAANNKITYKLGMLAADNCKELVEAYNDCAAGKTFSVAWTCRDAYNKSQDCIHKYLNLENVNLVKRRWVDAGRPMRPDWGTLFAGIVDK